MLLFRSISLKIFLLLSINQLYAQEEYGYDDSDHNSEYNESADEHIPTDYSKYYSVDGPSSPQINPGSGFTGAEFSGFFPPQSVEYAGTKKNEKILTVPPLTFVPQVEQTQSLPFFSPVHQATNQALSAPLRDFFEESQKKQQIKDQNTIKPGPSYISHSLPLLNSASEDDVERIPPRPNKPKKTNKEDDFDKDINEHEENEETDNKNDKYGLELLKNSKPFVDYNTGKSSSSISQYPIAAGLTSTNSKLTPYQKYSFQPIVGASHVLSDKYVDPQPIKPFNPTYNLKKTEPLINIESQATENVPSHLKNHDCRKIENGGSEGMNCFVCTNAETNSKYTQCSFTSEKEPVEYYTGGSERYSVPAKSGHFRYRRYANKKVDPYYLIRDRSRKTFEEPSIPEDYSSGYQYEPEHYEESPSEASFSEQQSEELKKNPENCKKVEKDGSTCTVCRNPKTGGNFEQCSYTSQPQEKKYAYVKEKKYNSDDEPEESKVVPTKKAADLKVIADLKVATTEEKPEAKLASEDFEPVEDYEGQINQNTKNPKKRDNDDPIQYENYEKNRKKSEQRFLNEKYEIPNHFAESVVQETRNNKNNDEDSSKDFDEYHFKLFPELTKDESKQEEAEEAEEEYQIPESTKQNVEEVLAEFTKKDRSDCKKSEKNGMTCFLCVDKNKIQHEECMFVQESRPKSSHVAYHQLKGIKKLENDEEPADETKNKPVVVTEGDIKKDLSEISSLVAEASETFEKAVPFKEVKRKYRKKKSPKKYNKKTEPTQEPTLKTPTEFDVNDEEGAFSAETRPVYSKIHGVSLPKYMIDKSEFEKEFDAFSGAL